MSYIKWFNKLSDMEILEIHKKALGDNIDVSDIVIERSDEYPFCVVSFERESNNSDVYTKRFYSYSDFNVFPFNDPELIKANKMKPIYIKYMIDKFGIDYLVDLMAYKVGLEKSYIEKIMDTWRKGMDNGG